MRQDIEQKLSMLLDDELELQEALALLEQIESDSALRRVWGRYTAASEAIRSGIYATADDGFVNRVSAAIGEEPVPLSSRVADDSGRSGSIRIALALAASVAVLAIVVGYYRSAEMGFSGGAVQVADALPEPAAIDPTPEPADSIDPRFSDYLATHNESAYSAGTQGILPYARFANYGSDR